MDRLDIIREDETLEDLQINGFSVIQKKEGFRFGMDAVLLANFAKLKKRDEVVDLCSGTGIIPFVIMAKNSISKITGVEIQDEMVEMANRTARYNNVNDKAYFVNGDLKDKDLIKTLGKVDVVTVNPPYKLKDSGLINLDDRNSIARHEICCTLKDVVEAASILLKDKGRFYMVHRPERIADIICEMRSYNIEPKLIKIVHPSIKKRANLILIEGQKNGGNFLKWDTALYVYDENGQYTEDMNRIYYKRDDDNE